MRSPLIGKPRHQRLHITQRQALEMHQADNNIGHLHAGVVDVILHIDLLPGRPQQSHKGIAQDRIPQMPHMRGLVGIDARVLHQRMQMLARRLKLAARGNRLHSRAAIQPRIDVSCARDLKARKPSTAPSAATISSAILRGAFFSLRASSNASGSAYSPNLISGGCSITKLSSSIWYISRSTARSRFKQLLLFS